MRGDEIVQLAIVADSLDDDARLEIVYAVEAKHQDAFYDTSPHLAMIERRLTPDELFKDFADATKQCMDRAKRRRGRPTDNPALKGFVAALREFWVEKLGRSFCDSFQDDSEFDPVKGMYPVNDASRFVVWAVQILIGDDVEVATCRYMMRQVNGAT